MKSHTANNLLPKIIILIIYIILLCIIRSAVNYNNRCKYANRTSTTYTLLVQNVITMELLLDLTLHGLSDMLCVECRLNRLHRHGHQFPVLRDVVQ